MQFIASLSGTNLIIVSAIVLLFVLVLILSSFLLNSRRIIRLESENESLRLVVETQGTALDELKSNLQTLTRHFASSDKTIRFLNKSSEELIDKQQQIMKDIELLFAKLEADKKSILQSIPENHSTMDATYLIKQGLSVDEVVEKTSMPRYEVEMLYAVHGKKKERKPSRMQAKASDEVVIDASVVNKKPQNGRPIASLKARNAYGIGSLKRR